jgi:hypothetical protein
VLSVFHGWGRLGSLRNSSLCNQSEAITKWGTFLLRNDNTNLSLELGPVLLYPWWSPTYRTDIGMAMQGREDFGGWRRGDFDTPAPGELVRSLQYIYSAVQYSTWYCTVPGIWYRYLLVVRSYSHSYLQDTEYSYCKLIPGT